jgi:hypothetical protein
LLAGRVLASRDDPVASSAYPYFFEYLWHFIFGEPPVNPELTYMLHLLETEENHVFTNIRSPCIRPPEGPELVNRSRVE